jgi:mannosyl-oligosaccharide glucosidase
VAAKYVSKFDQLKESHSKSFESKFKQLFPTLYQQFQNQYIDLAHYALSNLIGGIGYFHGQSIVNDAPDDEEALFEWRYYQDDEESERNLSAYESKRQARTKIKNAQSLLTSTPSRSHFPRGFLWDEGFQLLLVQMWDSDLSLDILKSWYQLMDQDGWIAREQILGEEARSKVPREFQEQSSFIANPPAILISIQQALGMLKSSTVFEDPGSSQGKPNSRSSKLKAFLSSNFAAMMKQWKWYRQTQFGDYQNYGGGLDNPEVYRWRGRTLNHNFASGLDDYPRANPPHVGELHLDLTCWMAWQAGILADVAKEIQADPDVIKSLESAHLNGIRNIKTYFWSEKEQLFGDLRVTLDDEGRELEVHRGYLATLPLALQLLDPVKDKKMFRKTLALIKELARPGFGVRSLSHKEDLYGKGEDYWRGNIWMNFQYMILRSLSHYGQQDQESKDLYQVLRMQVIETVHKGFQSTGFLHENYRGDNGEPRGAHPFTGWTSLILLIMNETY